MKKKRKFYLKYRQDDDPHFKLYYKKYCKVLTKVIKEAKKVHYDNKISKSYNKIKTTWSIIKKETGSKTQTDEPQSPKVNNIMIQNKKCIANVLNEYFTSVAQTIIDDLNNNKTPTNISPLYYLGNKYTSTFKSIKWQYVSTAEIRKIIKSLKTKSSHGYDEISTRILKASMPYITSPLTYICNQSLAQGTFPDRMKFAVVKPIFKSGNKYEPANYRPISLLSAFSKVLERVIYNKLYEHIDNNLILDNNQYGFRPNSSTEKASFKLIEEILKAMNNRQFVGGIFCDLHKAFDCINHGILINKFEFYGITGKFGALIKSYLNGRYQRVTLVPNSSINSSSSWAEVKFGVPQGSILGPLIFLLYINDITKVSINGTNIFLYADDTSIIVTNPEYADYKSTMTRIFCNINTWFRTNLLKLNIHKTHTLQFTLMNYEDHNMHNNIDQNLPTNLECIKFLGLNIDNRLCWKNHIDYLVTKLSSSCFLMRTVKPMISLSSLRMIYFAYIHSVMTYGIIFWGNSSYMTKLFMIQKKVIRIMMGLKKRDSCRDSFKEMKILPLCSQYIYSLMQHTINNMHLFTRNTEVHNIGTRQNVNLFPPSTSLTKVQKGAYYSGIKIYNHLPKELKQLSNNQKSFERSLKRFLHANSFYALNEYFNYKCT